LEIEETARRCDRLITEWGTQHGLQFNPKKTIAVVLKLPKGRTAKKYWNTTIRMGENSVKFSQTVRCLGVTLDRGFLFNAHARDIVPRVDWGVSFWTGRLITGQLWSPSSFTRRVRSRTESESARSLRRCFVWRKDTRCWHCARRTELLPQRHCTCWWEYFLWITWFWCVQQCTN